MYQTSNEYRNLVYTDAETTLDIYINNTLISADYILDCKIGQDILDGTLRLGTTTSKYVELLLYKDSITNVSSIKVDFGLKVNGQFEIVPLGTFLLDDIKDNDDGTITIKGIDNMVKFNFNYDASNIVPCTLKALLNDICTKAGVQFANTSFLNENVEVNVYDNALTAREYVGWIAEQAGCIATIDRTGKLYFKDIAGTQAVDLDNFDDYKFSEQHIVSKVIYNDAIRDFSFGTDTNNTLWINEENVYIVNSEQVQNVFNKINGLELYGFEGTTIIDPSVDFGDIIVIDNKNVLFQGEMDFVGRFKVNIRSNIDCKQKEQTTKNVGEKAKYKRLAAKIDQAEGKITLLASEQSETAQKVSEITQTVDEINSKISDIADITVSKESVNGILEFEDINQSEPISIKIHPIRSNISYLYPRDNLYVSEDLFMTSRTLRFTNTTTNERWDYELPDDLLIYDNENYDEFVFSYDSLSVMINKKCCYNVDGNVSLLYTPKIINYDFPKIELTDGDYKVELLGYGNVYMFVRLMAQNIYTTQFATKAEMNSEIKQTTEEVDISVNKKLESYSTTDEMNSAINVKANNISSEVSKKVGNDEIISKINQSAEVVRILARLIDINGVISANGNFKVNTDGTIECTNAKIKAVDEGIDSKNCGVVSESTNYVGEYYSDGLDIYNKNIDNADFAIVRPNGITTYNANRYGFDFWVGSDGRITWIVKDAAGKLLQASDTQFNLWSPGQNTNLTLNSNGAYINGYPIQTATSDRRLKTNIQDSTENALEKIMQIRHRAFTWKENGQEQKNGYIAQELEKIDKEFVINEDDKYSINVLNLLATTTKAMQELNLKVEELEQEIKLKGGKWYEKN